jgi:hypothetical protein
MNEVIAKLYDQSLIIESNGDYVSGELDPVKFAKLIVRECIEGITDEIDDTHPRLLQNLVEKIKDHFGIE